jgi:glycogen debranching enzyme
LPTAAYSDGIFQWDTCFMTMFNRFGWDSYLPTVVSLNNFYQNPMAGSNGTLVHCIDPGGPVFTIGPNVIGWAEWEHYLLTGDKERLRYALPFLVQNFKEYKRVLDRNRDLCYRGLSVGVEALSWNAWGNKWPIKTFMDVAAQQAYAAVNIADMAHEIGDAALEKDFRQHAEEHNRHIQAANWNEATGFFHHQLKEGFHPPFQIMGFFPMLSGAATPVQAARMVRHLYDPLRFQKDLPVPSTATCDKRLVDLSPNQKKPDQLGLREFGLHTGIYWSGGVWAPTNWIVIRALERNGYHAAARDIVERYLANMQHVYRKGNPRTFMSKTGFPKVFPERHDGPRVPSPNGEGFAVWRSAEFTGWTGLLPVSGLIEQLIGMQTNAPANEIVWRPQSLDRHGMAKLRFGPATATLIMAQRADYSKPAVIDITTDKPFGLRVLSRGVAFEKQVPAGTTRWEVGVVPSQFAPDPGVPGKAAAPTQILAATLNIDGAKLGMD